MASVPSDPAHPLFDGLARAEVQSLRFERGDTGDNHLLELVLRHDAVLPLVVTPSHACGFDGYEIDTSRAGPTAT